MAAGGGGALTAWAAAAGAAPGGGPGLSSTHPLQAARGEGWLDSSVPRSWGPQSAHLSPGERPPHPGLPAPSVPGPRGLALLRCARADRGPMLSWVHKELGSQVLTGAAFACLLHLLPSLPSLSLSSDFPSDPLVKLVLLAFITFTPVRES